MSSPPPWKPGREGPTVEWKVVLPRSDRVAATICAFANGVGGTLIVGVSDAGEVVGVDDPAAVRRALEEIATERIAPPARLRIRSITVAGCVVVEARVPASADGPVAVLGRSAGCTVYLREGSSSRPADARELRALARRSPPVALVDEDRRVLAALRKKSLRTADLARVARLGARAAKRAAVRLVRAGYVLERDDGRLWITPAGHGRSGPH